MTTHLDSDDDGEEVRIAVNLAQLIHAQFKRLTKRHGLSQKRMLVRLIEIGELIDSEEALGNHLARIGPDGVPVRIQFI